MISEALHIKFRFSVLNHIHRTSCCEFKSSSNINSSQLNCLRLYASYKRVFNKPLAYGYCMSELKAHHLKVWPWHCFHSMQDKAWFVRGHNTKSLVAVRAQQQMCEVSYAFPACSKVFWIS